MKTITVAPLSTPQTLTKAAWDAIQNASVLYLQTREHPGARPVLEAGLPFVSMDDLYESAEDFEALNAAIAEFQRFRNTRSGYLPRNSKTKYNVTPKTSGTANA